MKPKRKEGLELVRLETGEIGIANFEEGTVTVCDPIVAMIWLLCDGTRSEREIAEILRDECEINVELEEIEKEVKRIIEEMKKAGLIE